MQSSFCVATNTMQRNKTRYLLCFLILLATAAHLPAIQRDLPVTNDFDEPTRVVRSIRMAATGDLNPGWFGNPGSTMFYPLTVMYHTWYAVTQHGSFLHPNPGLQVHFDSGHAWEYYLLGRCLAVTYGILTVPFLFFFGKRVFGRRVAIAGTVIYIFSPIALFYARMVRTDSAATFYGLICLWRCVILFQQPNRRNQLLAGVTLGLAIATRYFMVTLTTFYAGVNILLFLADNNKSRRQSQCMNFLFGLLMIVVAFAITTPYFFLDFDTVLQNYQHESRPENLGYDGLSRIGNFLWYLTTGLPKSATWPQVLFATIGIVFILRQHKPLPLLLLGFVTVFLVTISFPALHWPRWTLPILPIIALFASFAAERISHILARKFPDDTRLKHYIRIAGLLVLFISPVYQSIMLTVNMMNFSTRVHTANWMRENLPAGSYVALENIYMDVKTPELIIHTVGTLVDLGLTPAEMLAQGYQYAIANQDNYRLYYEEPARYSEAIAFYETLFKEALLIQEFKHSTMQGGPTLQIYQLVAQPDG